MKIGIHAYAWCSEWSNRQLNIIDKAKAYGFDFLEIPLMVIDQFDSKSVKQRKDAVKLDCVTSTVLLGNTDVTSDDPEMRRNGVKYLKRCIDATRDIESDSFSGVIYSQYIKPAKKAPTAETWKYSADCLREVARYAKPYGIMMGIEPVTRYESYLINTCEEAIRLIDMIGEDNVQIHLDTYHMNVEEQSFYEATKLAYGRLMHYHMCENDRGIPGTGHVDWDGIFRALKEMDYRGRIGMEGFSDVTDNMSTWVWRQLAPNADTFVRSGLAFLRSMASKYGL